MTIEERIADLERRMADVERITTPLMPLGPRRDEERLAEERNVVVNRLLESLPKPVDRSARVLTSGLQESAQPDYRELKDNGQQKAYLVLSADERAKGFVRPVRRSYRHVGSRPQFSLRDLTGEEAERYAQYKYVKFESYPESHRQGSSVIGRFWTQEQLDRRGCGGVTTMDYPIAETYARDPQFYGATFCCQCGTHLPVAEFVWEGTDERVGS